MSFNAKQAQKVVFTQKFLKSAHADPRPGYDNVCYYAWQFWQINRGMLRPQASRGVVLRISSYSRLYLRKVTR